MKNILNKNLICILILAESFFLWTPTIHAEEIKLSVPKVEKKQGPKMTPEQIKAFIKKNGKIKTGPRITNSKAVERRAAIIATLRTQKQAADAQRATFRAAIKVAPTSPALTPSPAQPVAPPSTSLMQSRSGPAGNLQMSKNVPSIGSSRLESESVKPALNIPSAAVVQGKVSNTQMQCTPDRQGIWDINGMARKKIIFTPDSDYNTFTINGCGFGDVQGTAHLYGPFKTTTVNLIIDYWSDKQIIANVPNISGELDHDNVTLVIVPIGKPQMQNTGHSFYAMRETTLVSQIPGNVKSIGDSGYPVLDKHLFPGSSVEVDRGWNNSQAGIAPDFFLPQNIFDYYDFSHHLKPGFTTDSFWYAYSYVNPSSCNSFQGGPPVGTWVGDNIQMEPSYYLCAQDNFIDHGFILSNYGLSVWVVGPKGVDPWQ